jgi:hypothetical protein
MTILSGGTGEWKCILKGVKEPSQHSFVDMLHPQIKRCNLPIAALDQRLTIYLLEIARLKV